MEQRRRTRYALQAAFWSLGYYHDGKGNLSRRDLHISQLFPGDDPTKKKYFPVPYEDFLGPSSDATLGTQSGLSVSGPKGTERVRVLWINCNLLDTHPLLRMRLILDEFGDKGGPVALGTSAIIGPPNSDWLLTMLMEDAAYPGPSAAVKDLERWKAFNLPKPPESNQAVDSTKPDDPVKPPDNLWSNRLRVLSPYATIDLGSIQWPWLKQHFSVEAHERNLNVTLPTVEFDKDGAKLGWCGVAITRIGPDDGDASDALLAEFARRNMDPGGVDLLNGGRRAILMVTEWDTNFGRAFAGAMHPKGVEVLNPLFFLRGLEGEVISRTDRQPAAPEGATPATGAANMPFAGLLDPKRFPVPDAQCLFLYFFIFLSSSSMSSVKVSSRCFTTASRVPSLPGGGMSPTAAHTTLPSGETT